MATKELMRVDERPKIMSDLCERLRANEEFDLINAVNRDKDDKKLREMLIKVIETGDIAFLDYEFDGGNLNLAYKSAEELIHSVAGRREYPTVIMYKATGSLNPCIVYKGNNTLSYNKETNTMIFNNNGNEIIVEGKNNHIDTALKVTTVMSAYKISPDPSVIIEILNEI